MRGGSRVLRSSLPIHRFLTAVGFAVTLAFAGITQAQSTDRDDEARLLFEAGARAFSAGDYEAALRRFQEAYELSGRPQLLFNIASTHDRLRHDGEALTAYAQFLEEVPEAQNRDYVEQRIELLRESVEADDATPPPESTDDAQAETDLSVHAADVDRSNDASAPPAHETSESRRRPWLWAIVGVVAAGAIATSVALAVRGGGGGGTDPIPGSFGGTIVTLGGPR